ncbi:hypothetical protein HDU91_007215, partial [Kappamyces sp. JEL0680]
MQVLLPNSSGIPLGEGPKGIDDSALALNEGFEESSGTETPASSFIFEDENLAGEGVEEALSNDTLLASQCQPFLHWNVAQQQGYKYGTFGSRARNALHSRIEDAYFPLKDTPAEEYTSNWGHKFFFMADGHAGHEAPHFFIAGLKKEIQELLNAKNWDFGHSEDQHELSARITEIYLALDQEYVRIKTNEYQHWVKGGCIPLHKPVDDGCTMMLNIIQHGWILNCNVGDSRSVLARTSPYEKDWLSCFSSIDHNMMNPQK